MFLRTRQYDERFHLLSECELQWMMMMQLYVGTAKELVYFVKFDNFDEEKQRPDMLELVFA